MVWMASVHAAGSPGPLDRKTPSGLSFKIASAAVFAGTIVNLHPKAISFCKMVLLIPKSSTTTWGDESSASHEYGSLQETSWVIFFPFIPEQFRACAMA